jgi:hypothetical protein
MKTKHLYLAFLLNVFGFIDDKIKERILNYINEPNVDNWEDIHGIIVVKGYDTIWQIICRIDPTFPRSGRSYSIF